LCGGITGETAVVSSYVGTSNGTALTAAVNDKGQNITLTRGADDTVHVSVAQVSLFTLVLGPKVDGDGAVRWARLM
jgi:hypothetical protein